MSIGFQLRFPCAEIERWAQNAVHVNDGGRITPVALAMLVVLPALPLSAAYRLVLAAVAHHQ